ncbi:diacylglycerol kinase family protein [Archaeoglobus neptunius]|uniref:diacylglycerol kinase family protein n=1 Tax=Archaeoglobus neptunius TaxID=2798580 RepID=UPI0019261FF0
MRVGVVVNPTAGGGLNQEKVELIVSTLKKLGGEVWTSGNTAKILEVLNPRTVEIPLKGTRDDTVDLVKKIDRVVDLIAVFGGDGTVSDAASARPESPLLCIGIGTTNVSPVLCPPDFDPDELKSCDMRGLKLKIGNEERIAFNDVVVGSTILATVGNKRVQVDARKFMMGERAVALPRKFRARVEVGERIVEGEFGNVFFSLSDRRFLGKGTAGGASLSAFLNFKAVVACVSEGIVVSTYTKDDLRKIEPIVTQTMSFDDETVRVWADEIISCDGNPVGEGYAEIEVLDRAVKVLLPKCYKF